MNTPRRCQDYCFDLDLTSKTENNSIKCTVNVNESKYVNPTSIETHLKCKYLQISNFTDLINEIIYGSQIIELTDNFSLNNINYVDIDVDVLDEKVFPYTVCKKENGLTLNKLFDLLTKLNLQDVKILSLSEYAYVLDDKKEGLKIIIQIINEFLKI